MQEFLTEAKSLHCMFQRVCPQERTLLRLRQEYTLSAVTTEKTRVSLVIHVTLMQNVSPQKRGSFHQELVFVVGYP